MQMLSNRTCILRFRLTSSFFSAIIRQHLLGQFNSIRFYQQQMAGTALMVHIFPSMTAPKIRHVEALFTMSDRAIDSGRSRFPDLNLRISDDKTTENRGSEYAAGTDDSHDVSVEFEVRRHVNSEVPRVRRSGECAAVHRIFHLVMTISEHSTAQQTWTLTVAFHFCDNRSRLCCRMSWELGEVIGTQVLMSTA